MPTVLYASAVREVHDDFVLSMAAQYTLFFAEENDIVYHAKGRMPNIDILTRGDVILTLSGILNNRPVPAADMKYSTPLKHFRDYLHMARYT